MSKAFNTSMFQSIKAALAKSNNEGGNATYTEIMKTSPGNTYTVRLLPYSPDPKNTFFHYFNHGWVSFATGQYVQSLSPMTFGERDPIAEERYRALRMGSEDEKEKAKAIKRTEKYLVNVYVVEDQSNPDNNGKVKLLRYGKQLHKIIMDAIEGEDAEEFGHRIFDLSKEGVNFKIKCENQGEYPTYVSSRFTATGKLNLSEDEQKKIYDSVFDLTKVFPLKSADELKQMLDEHYHCKSADEAPVREIQREAVKTPQAPTPAPVVASDEEDAYDDIDDLLKDL
jgi:hypothetical protein